MKKINSLIAVLGMLALASAAFGAEIVDIAWDQSNLETLRSFDAAAVARFLNSGLVEPPFVAPVEENGDFSTAEAGNIQEFTWANLSGNNQYQLVVVFGPLGSGGVNRLSSTAGTPPGR